MGGRVPKPKTTKPFVDAVLQAAESDYTTCAACRHYHVRKNSVRRDSVYSAVCLKDVTVRPVPIKTQRCGTLHLTWYRYALHCPYLDNIYEGTVDEMLRDKV